MFLNLVISCAIILCVIDIGYSTLKPNSPKSDKQNKQKIAKVREGPQDTSVQARNLVTENPTIKDILQNHKAFFKEIDEYNFDGFVLGFVTPWNNHGYDIAKLFGNKFTHISPVWLQIKRKSTKTYEVQGTHDIDQDWMIHVKNAGRERRVKIVPRLLFEGWKGNDFVQLFGDKEEVEALIKTMVKAAKKYSFSGYVLELWPQLAGRIQDSALIDLIKAIGDQLAIESLDLVLVIPPKRGDILFNDDHFDELYDYVTAFSLMTYDFNNSPNPGPNAPLPWIQDCIESLSDDKERRNKILTGFNFYGNDYHSRGVDSIVGHEFVKKIEEVETKIKFDGQMVEHHLEYKDSKGKHTIYYPTLHSINERIKLCRELGTGISIWELGQGLDYFYDLL